MKSSLLSVALVLAVAGCVASQRVAVQTLAPSEVAGLSADEGLLVIQLDSDLLVEWVATDRVRVETLAPVGRHVFVARVPPGRHVWRAIGVVHANPGRRAVARPMGRGGASPREAGDLAFDVAPGVVNYAGALEIRSIREASGEPPRAGFVLSNQAAIALREVTAEYPGLLRDRTLRDARLHPDGFLAHLESLRRKAEIDRTAPAASAISLPMAMAGRKAPTRGLTPAARSMVVRGLSAEALLAQDGVYDVSISPHGEWVVAEMRSGRSNAILVQRIGGGRALSLS